MNTAAAGPHAVAVVMPTRNQASFIEASIESVMAQGLPGLRLLVQDGASTDGTPALLERLAARHPALQWASAPDKGPADALNRVFARALADPAVAVIGWLNSDDLYTPGALARALAHFAAHPTDVAVYGEGQHVDAAGRSLERYPTRRPDTPLSAWADGCPICQPTMVLRREAVQALLPLDTGLRTAFDFDLWLRLFKGFPGRIGFVPEVQAHSRLHDEGITLRMREAVALEGMQVVHRHVGPAPAHWLLTHAGEALAACPFECSVETARQRLLALADHAAPWLGAGQHQQLLRDLRQHRAWMIARDGFVAEVHGDGWAPPALPVRLRQPARPYRQLHLWGRHAAAHGHPLELSADALAAGSDGWRAVVSRHGSFEVRLPLPALPETDLSFTLRTAPEFVPAQGGNSTDRRSLAFLLDAVQLG